jgi:hypothetical protein
MKKLVLLSALAILPILNAPQAFASKARLISLGQDTNGSEYIEDTRSIFLNPAQLNRVGDFANFEMGSSTVGTAPNAEGGFFNHVNNLHIGAQLGRETDLSQLITLTNSAMFPAAVAAISYPRNSFEVQIASGDSYKWGASIIYGTVEDRAEAPTPGFPNKKANTAELHGGLSHDNWDLHAALDLYGSGETQVAESQYNKFTLQPSAKVGGDYALDTAQKIYFNAVYANFTARNNTDPGDRTGSITSGQVGYAHFLNPEAATQFFYSMGLLMSNYKLGGIGNNADAKLFQLNIPVVIGLENAATDWLKLRASVSQKVFIDQTNTTATSYNKVNSTTVAAGAGVNWKKLTLDGTLAGSGTGQVDGNNLLANASLTYLF